MREHTQQELLNPLLTPDEAKSNDYKNYFKSGLYRKRFGKKETCLEEEYLIRSCFQKALEAFKKNKFNQEIDFQLLDFGCGDGRMFSMILQIADQLQKEGIKIKITGMDPEQEGLNKYQERLLENGFVAKDESTLSKDNIEIKLALGNQNNIKDLPSDFDMSICMFGVLSHIQTRQERQKTLKAIDQKTKGYFAITVPGKNIFRKRQEAFGELRTVDAQTEKFYEPGDLRYTIKGSENFPSGKTSNFYHLSSFDELREDLEKANFGISQMGISSISHPAKLSKNRLFDNVDKITSQILTKILPPKLASEVACYIGCIAKSSRLAKLEAEKPSAAPKPHSVEIEMVPLGKTKVSGGRDGI